MLLGEANPKRIIQIVSGSRSGSSLLKSLLARSPSVEALDGEEEPYVKMSGSGYGITSNSDCFSRLENPVLFRRMLQTELFTEAPLEWRLRLQYSGPVLARLLNRMGQVRRPESLLSWLRREGVAGHYDDCEPEERLPFQTLTYEMPPYVLPNLRRDVRRSNSGYTLLLKSPYKVYRRGLLEAAFPNAEFTYIQLLRNPAATINGLIAGWEAPYGFHKHLTPAGWWKFDLPDGWEPLQLRPVAERAWYQWMSSYSIIADWKDPRCVEVRFEDLLRDPAGTVRSLCQAVGIDPPEITELPRVMSTEAPQPGRWRRREEVLSPLLDRSQELIQRLGYGKDRSQWL